MGRPKTAMLVHPDSPAQKGYPKNPAGIAAGKAGAVLVAVRGTHRNVPRKLSWCFPAYPYTAAGFPMPAVPAGKALYPTRSPMPRAGQTAAVFPKVRRFPAVTRGFPACPPEGRTAGLKASQSERAGIWGKDSGKTENRIILRQSV